MPKLVNWGLMAQPVNWITVTLMVIIGTIALNLVLTPWHNAPITSTGLNANSEPGPDLATLQ